MTPLEKYPKLAKALGIKELYFKREDLHPYGSHKGRSIPVMIDHYIENGASQFAITGSGNASLAAALHVKKTNEKRAEKISLRIFAGQHISNKKFGKLEKLVNDNIQLFKKERPLQALQQAIAEGATSLRQSTDDTALLGYEELAGELDDEENVSAIFMGTSSGTTAQALAEYFTKNDAKNRPQIHTVQTSSCHPIADALNAGEFVTEKSVADAIVDQTAFRKNRLVPLIAKTGGMGWIASNEEIERARELVSKYAGINISVNSALSVVGAMKAAYVGHEMKGIIICMICGD